MNILMNQYGLLIFGLRFCNTCVSQLRSWFNFFLIRFYKSLIHFRFNGGNGDFAVLVFIDDNVNLYFWCLWLGF